ncbi:hypothetical protein BJX65DRAFT_73667 [Aspergillus insuetus]
MGRRVFGGGSIAGNYRSARCCDRIMIGQLPADQMSANAQGQSDKTLTRVSDIHRLESRLSPLDVSTFFSRKLELWKPPTALRGTQNHVRVSCVAANFPFFFCAPVDPFPRGASPRIQSKRLHWHRLPAGRLSFPLRLNSVTVQLLMELRATNCAIST